MRKSDVFNLVGRVSVTFLLYDSALKPKDIRYSTTQATVQQSYAASTVNPVSLSHVAPEDQTGYRPTAEGTSSQGSDAHSNAEADFSSLLRGGTLLHFDLGMIVVQAQKQPESLQPTALTIDAIITSSLRSKIAAQPQLQSDTFRIRTDNGVVQIFASAQSLEQAAVVINIALTVPNVRQIVYLRGSEISISSFLTRGLALMAVLQP